MNVTILAHIIRSSPRLFTVMGALLVLNIGLLVYGSVMQQRVEGLQNSWFEKRKSLSQGGAVDTASVYRQGVNDLKTWRSRIVPKKTFARLVGTLFETAGNNNLNFSGITYKTTQYKSEALTAYNLTFNLSGKYGAIKSFLSDVGQMREMVVIDTMSLDGDPTSDSIALNLQLTVLLKPEEQ